MAFKSIRNDRLSDKVALEIIQKIQSRELAPGDKLPPENQLADILGVSRGILREALTVLQARGYIRRKPKDGTYVSETLEAERLNGSVMSVLKKGSYLELIEMREGLEMKVVEVAVRRASDEDILDLIEQLESGQGDEVHSNIDHYFHFRLAELSGNSLFMSFIDMYYDLISEIAQQSRKNLSRRDAIEAEHLAIAYAIRDRNLEEARRAVQHHMKQVAQAVEKLSTD